MGRQFRTRSAHWTSKCALDQCQGPLVNYKDGRFCEAHLNLRDVCGIIPCGLPVRHPGALTCATDSHIQWYRQYAARFSRLSFAGVRRVIRRQQGLADDVAANVNGPTLQVSLPALGNTPGNQVVHTFKAKSTYCLQTVQLACGYPIGWGKCYRSENQVSLLMTTPAIFCAISSHRTRMILGSSLPNSSSMRGTTSTTGQPTFCAVYGAILPPKNGSQPDLVLVEEDADGVQHQTRAFNTETAEQLNSWLNGFESQLLHMSDVNYDFFVHVLMILYAERVEKHVVQKDLGLSDDFWAEATGD
ncbi:hypothetical protein MVEN_00032700 [Mycena venus]|uniref:CxC6 like cysteine cluster associated with KDZ domain-containing protein n=1 Tax=Mycena venus TaxID=2733690 RepID=A0A8H6Z7H5_9AGAR|nr:hypothetical protein MVEN_00032700 [Mycena venus]